VIRIPKVNEVAARVRRKAAVRIVFLRIKITDEGSLQDSFGRMLGEM
jgi:hypothetical protein